LVAEPIGEPAQREQPGADREVGPLRGQFARGPRKGPRIAPVLLTHELNDVLVPLRAVQRAQAGRRAAKEPRTPLSGLSASRVMPSSRSAHAARCLLAHSSPQ